KAAIVSMKGELVYFDTSDRIRLCGFLSRPKQRTDKMVIHLHGLQGNFYGSTYINALSETFTKKGFNFLSIEQHGSYTIKGTKRGRSNKAKRILLGGALERFEDCVYDIDGA